MTTTNLKPHVYIANAFYSHPIEQRDANVLEVFKQFKTSFNLREAFKIKGKLYEFYQCDTGTYTYYLILKNGQVEWHTGSNIYAPAIDKWRELTKTQKHTYINGCPHYEFKNAKDVEIVFTQDRYLEFHKIASSRAKGCTLKSNFVPIAGTPFSIGNPIMYTLKDGKNEFFYDKGFSIEKYDVEYNLALGVRFNTRYRVVSAISGHGKQKAIQELIQGLNKEMLNHTKGYWRDNILDKAYWVEPNPENAAKLQKTIDAVILFSQVSL